jgi:hypothetical protein
VHCCSFWHGRRLGVERCYFLCGSFDLSAFAKCDWRFCTPPRETLYHQHQRWNLGARGSMDSPLVTQLFRQLFSHRASRCLARRTCPSVAFARHAYVHQRGLATRYQQGETSRESKWAPRTNNFPYERSDEFDRYPTVTADMLRTRRERPRRVKMLMRDFIEGW